MSQKNRVVIICKPGESYAHFETTKERHRLEKNGWKFQKIDLGKRMKIEHIINTINEFKPDFVLISTAFEPHAFHLSRMSIEFLAIKNKKVGYDIGSIGLVEAPPTDGTLAMENRSHHYKRLNDLPH